MSTQPFHDRATWKEYWWRIRWHWRTMKHYGSWDGKAQYREQLEWKRVYTFKVYGKSGKQLRQFCKTHIGRFDRDEVAERWATVKESLTVGQTATLTLNGNISRTYKHNTPWRSTN